MHLLLDKLSKSNFQTVLDFTNIIVERVGVVFLVRDIRIEPNFSVSKRQKRSGQTSETVWSR